MALIKVVTENDIGKGLAIENTKLVAKGDEVQSLGGVTLGYFIKA